MGNIRVEYRFRFADGAAAEFVVELDEETLAPGDPPPGTPPAWTLLELHQCPNCPLRAQTHPHCPLCVRITPLVERFRGIRSIDEIELEVVTRERRTTQRTTAQRAVGSLLGLLSATSGCPHTAWFKPMARFHLPLASEEETIFRATAMYLLAQYFRSLDGGAPDLSFEGLTRIYRQIHVVNTALAERLRAATHADSSVNAVIILDMFTKSVPVVIEESLGEIRHLFTSYLAQ